MVLILSQRGWCGRGSGDARPMAIVAALCYLTLVRGWQSAVGNLLELLRFNKAYRGLQFSGACMKNRRVRFHRIRECQTQTIQLQQYFANFSFKVLRMKPGEPTQSEVTSVRKQTVRTALVLLYNDIARRMIHVHWREFVGLLGGQYVVTTTVSVSTIVFINISINY